MSVDRKRKVIMARLLNCDLMFRTQLEFEKLVELCELFNAALSRQSPDFIDDGFRRWLAVGHDFPCPANIARYEKD